jgi:hypothetical protein
LLNQKDKQTDRQIADRQPEDPRSSQTKTGTRKRERLSDNFEGARENRKSPEGRSEKELWKKEHGNDKERALKEISERSKPEKVWKSPRERRKTAGNRERRENAERKRIGDKWTERSKCVWERDRQEEREEERRERKKGEGEVLWRA